MYVYNFKLGDGAVKHFNTSTKFDTSKLIYFEGDIGYDCRVARKDNAFLVHNMSSFFEKQNNTKGTLNFLKRIFRKKPFF